MWSTIRLKGMERVIHTSKVVNEMSGSKEHMFQQFVKDAHPAALRLATLLLGTHQSMAQDIVQKAFLSAWRHLKQQAEAEQLPAWFRRIVINEVRSYFRWHGVRHRLKGVIGMDSDNISEPAQPDHGLRQRLAGALSTLSLRQREIFVLVYLNDLRVSEAARLVGCADGTAKAHLYRAVHQLRAELSDLRSSS